MDVETRDIPTRLGTLHVQITGTGDPILLWPSLLLDHTLWQAQVDHFAPRFTTIALDPPGHGASTPLTRTFTFDECATCIAQILDELGFDRAHIIGNSWGAMIGATFAARYPDRVSTAVLMNGTASPAPRRQRLEYAALLAIARVLRGIRPPLTRSVVSAFLGPTSRRTRPEVVETMLHVARANNVASVTPAIRSVVSQRPDQRRLLGEIRTPTLVVAGREDATFPPAEVEEMARCIPDAEFVLLDGAAHLVALEVPDTVNTLIDDFLTRQPPSSHPSNPLHPAE
ncbi:alpha/beta fold hydrolase [Nocardia colli]|uniref:Alpha/beta fold hydrolase n=1 Tax=Nocardia colli TaxID=2545717 RepID=A0A5N0E7T0_9NOCA|nr:alpha/beta hydrolase [Nocardia colli]KAA8885482.1 alpha/beta fold hydrolase [Nocardia colli]